MDKSLDNALDTLGQPRRNPRSRHGHDHGHPNSALTMDTDGGVYIPRQVQQGHSPIPVAELADRALYIGQET